MQKSPIEISFLWSRDEPADFRDFLLHCQLIELEGLNVRDALESAIKTRDDQRKRATEQKSRIIEPGDTLAIYIEGILPYSAPDRMVDPPLVQAGKNSPVWGYPVTVDAKGQIVLPLIGNVPLDGVEIASAVKQIHQQYGDKNILPGERENVISLSMLRKSGQGLEIRMLSGAKDKDASTP